MRKIVLAALAATAFAAPAAAQPGWYVGVEGGFNWARGEGIDISFPDSGGIPLGGAIGPAAVGPEATFNSFLSVDYKTGYDIDLIGGYDWGWMRTELELSQKRTKHDEYSAFFSPESIDADGSTRVQSAMINALVQAHPGAGWSVYAGPGIGIANVRMKFKADEFDGESFRIKDSGLGLQAIAGITRQITPNLGLGLKYRYFEATGIKDKQDDVFCLSGDSCTFKTRYRSHSLLASLTYSFARPAPMPVATIPPAPVPVAPVTQTCADGSVIDASAMCPIQAPAPAPAPAPTGERG